jgi:hypothetical protein
VSRAATACYRKKYNKVTSWYNCLFLSSRGNSVYAPCLLLKYFSLLTHGLLRYDALWFGRLVRTFRVNMLLPCSRCGPGSSVGIATDNGLDGPGIEFRWGRDFPPVQTGPGAHPASCTMDNGSFPGVKCGRGVLLTTHPL